MTSKIKILKDYNGKYVVISTNETCSTEEIMMGFTSQEDAEHYASIKKESLQNNLTK